MGTKAVVGKSKAFICNITNTKDQAPQDLSPEGWKVSCGEGWVYDKTIRIREVPKKERLLLFSNGLAMQLHGDKMGVYVLDEGISNGRPTYRHKENNNYLYFNPYSCWTVCTRWVKILFLYIWLLVRNILIKHKEISFLYMFFNLGGPKRKYGNNKWINSKSSESECTSGLPFWWMVHYHPLCEQKDAKRVSCLW